MQEYITQIGQYLMTLPQHLEPYMNLENTPLNRAFQEQAFPYSNNLGDQVTKYNYSFINTKLIIR